MGILRFGLIKKKIKSVYLKDGTPLNGPKIVFTIFRNKTDLFWDYRLKMFTPYSNIITEFDYHDDITSFLSRHYQCLFDKTHKYKLTKLCNQQTKNKEITLIKSNYKQNTRPIKN